MNAKSSLLCLKAIDSILDNNVIDTDHSECSNLLMEVSRNRVEKHFVEMQKDSDFGLESKWKCNEDILSPIILGLISHWSTNQTILTILNDFGPIRNLLKVHFASSIPSVSLFMTKLIHY